MSAKLAKKTDINAANIASLDWTGQEAAMRTKLAARGSVLEIQTIGEGRALTSADSETANYLSENTVALTDAPVAEDPETTLGRIAFQAEPGFPVTLPGQFRWFDDTDATVVITGDMGMVEFTAVGSFYMARRPTTASSVLLLLGIPTYANLAAANAAIGSPYKVYFDTALGTINQTTV